MQLFFYDTWAFVALSNSSDPGHDLASGLDRLLEREGLFPVTTDYVLDETLTTLNVSAGARTALAFLGAFEARIAAGSLRFVEITADRRARAVAEFRKCAPKTRGLSFTDATSFAVMRELSIRHAFTADRHFHAAGAGIRPLVEFKAGRFSPIRLT